MSRNIILKYFPELTSVQQQKFQALEELYSDWNSKINVVSRKDMDSLMEKHVLHSLGIAKCINFKSGTKILDVGTGGGFPGIPLAIMFPEVEFTLVDSIGKKIMVVESVAESLDLKNVVAKKCRAEEIKSKFHFVVSRAVTQMPVFLSWMKGKFEKENTNEKDNGILYLKGGDLTEELKGIPSKIISLNKYFEEDFFETKKVVYIAAKDLKKIMIKTK